MYLPKHDREFIEAHYYLDANKLSINELKAIKSTFAYSVFMLRKKIEKFVKTIKSIKIDQEEHD